MTRPEDYLAIPDDYCRWLGGLRWSPNREAVEFEADREEGRTFAMAAEVALFVEGFQSGAPLVCFGFVLHLLHLLGMGARVAPSASARRVEGLAQAFRATGRPVRNAGALAALLCRGLPRAADPPEGAEVARFLTRAGTAAPPPRGRGEVPPLDPAAFEARVVAALAGFSADVPRHWMRHGRGPAGPAGAQVAALVPPNLATVLADLERRPRLAGAASLVAPLAGALALPPRRLARSEQPTGGYADVATRGLAEQILPHQFALDAEEFLRRFAEHELLYFHREEPHAPVAEELVVVVDQGVRTWGDVRLALAAAALALGRQAARRGLPLFVATTGSGAPRAASEIGREELGTLLEASDLSPHPARALELALNADRAGLRDVVLLTHPRSLAEPAVAAAARRAAAGTRLFAVAVDNEGRVELSELRQGTPVVLGRCRVEVREPAPAASASAPAPALPESSSARSWHGPVEPVGFPFRIGPVGRIDDRLYAFDDSGDWVLVASQLGLLHAWRADGSKGEMLPRASIPTGLIASVEAVIGVAGGFVVVGRTKVKLAAIHYDFPGRAVSAHVIGDLSSWGPGRRWTYCRELHAVVAQDPGNGRVHGAIDLGAEPDEAIYHSSPPSPPASSRARSAAMMNVFQPPPNPVIVDQGAALPEAGRAVRLDPETGTIDIQDDAGRHRVCRPLADGRPALKGARVLAARSGGDVIGALASLSGAQQSLFLFSAGSFRSLGSYPVGNDVKDFAISPDGRRFARRIGDRHLEIRNMSGGALPLHVTPKGKAHPHLDVSIGETFLIINTGKHVHMYDWYRGPLRATLSQGEPGWLIARVISPIARRQTVRAARRTVPTYDDRRFVASERAFGLTVLVDMLSQVTVLDADDKIVCMFYVFRDQAAAWMPDGTRVGLVPVSSGPSTPDAMERIGAALRAAVSRGKGPAS